MSDETSSSKPFIFTADLKARWLEALQHGKYARWYDVTGSGPNEHVYLSVLIEANIPAKDGEL